MTNGDGTNPARWADGYLISHEGQPYIQCLRCGFVSYHPRDIQARYCGRCHVFHDDPPPDLCPPGDQTPRS